MYAYPPKARFSKTIPKTLIYTNAKPSPRIKALIVSQIAEIIWQFKLSPETVNLPAADGYTELHAFDIALKSPDLSPDVIQTLDKAIPYPVFYRLLHGDKARHAAAYKRPAQDAPTKWVVVAAYETPWEPADTPGLPLPVALNMKSLYEQMLLPYIPQKRTEGESLPDLVDREYRIRQTQRQIRQLETKLHQEKQFNRKAEINAEIRRLHSELSQMNAGGAC